MKKNTCNITALESSTAIYQVWWTIANFILYHQYKWNKKDIIMCSYAPKGIWCWHHAFSLPCWFYVISNTVVLPPLSSPTPMRYWTIRFFAHATPTRKNLLLFLKLSGLNSILCCTTDRKASYFGDSMFQNFTLISCFCQFQIRTFFASPLPSLCLLISLVIPIR